jgi:cation diffusion facilitator family transporter
VRATLIGMVANTLLALVKLVTGMVGNSQALVADGVESLADLFSSMIVWRGLVIAAAPADEDHPYGHGKAEPIAAAMVATLLLFAAFWIAVESFKEIVRPQTTPAAYTLFVLLGVVITKELLFRFAIGEGRALDSPAVRSDAWHHRSDAITSLAAGLGIGVALIGGEGFEAADDAAAMLAAGVIGWNGWQLWRDAVKELMDTAPDPVLIEAIRTTGGRVKGAVRIEKCHVRKVGQRHYVDMHVEVNPMLSVRDAHEIAHSVKDEIRRRHPGVLDVLVHVEPATDPFVAPGQTPPPASTR